MSPTAGFRGEQFFPDGIENRARHDFPALLVGDRHGEHRETVGEVGGSIQRVDDEAAPGFRAAHHAALLGEDGDRRLQPLQAFDDCRLGRVVNGGYEVDGSLQIDPETAFRPGAMSAAHHHGPRLGRLDAGPAGRGPHGDWGTWRCTSTTRVPPRSVRVQVTPSMN